MEFHATRSQQTTVVATWNVQWTSKTSRRFGEVYERISGLNAEILCLTEATKELLPRGGHFIESGSDYGCGVQQSRRKVILWARNPWLRRDSIGTSELPPGRFASGTLELHGRRIRVIGVCIPWRDAHVNSGNKNRRRWEDHESYLIGLQKVLSRESDLPTIVLGDFNQKLHPQQKTSAPIRCRDLLIKTFDGFELVTKEATCDEGKGLIDHVGLTSESDLKCCQVKALPRFGGNGVRLSDHPAVVTEFAWQ